MGRSRALSTYPQEFWAICEAVASGKSYRLRMAKGQALNIRQRFYAFRAALERDGDVGPPDIVVKNKEALRTAPLVFVDISMEGIVDFIHRDDQPLARLLRQRVEIPPRENEQLDKAARESEARMLAQMNPLADPTTTQEVGDSHFKSSTLFEDAQREAEEKKKGYY